jgi:glutamate transport system substrate-binding protein
MKGNVMKAFLTRRKSFVVAASAALALTLSACGGGGGTTSNPSVAEKPTFAAGSTMEKLSKAGTIKIGTKFDQPLFGQVGLDGKPIGFDVEMGKLIAAKLGIAADKIEWSETVSANREPFIEQGKVDLVIATYTINDKRKQVVSFAGPYYEAGQALMVNKDNDTIKKPEDVKGKKVCSVTGSTPAGTIVEKYGA